MEDQNQNTTDTNTSEKPLEKSSRVIQPLTPDLKPTSVADSISQFTGQTQDNPQPAAVSPVETSATIQAAPSVPQPQPAIAAPVQPVNPALTPPQPAVPFDASKIYPTVAENPSPQTLTDATNQSKDILQPNPRLSGVISGILVYGVIQIIIASIGLYQMIQVTLLIYDFKRAFSAWGASSAIDEAFYISLAITVFVGIHALFGIYILFARNKRLLSTAMLVMLLLGLASVLFSSYLYFQIMKADIDLISWIHYGISIAMLIYLFTIKRSVDMYRA